MAILKKVAFVAVMAGAGIAGTAGFASAAANDSWQNTEHHEVGDNGTGQGGLVPVSALGNVGVTTNVGCLANHTVPDLTAQSLVGLVPIAASLNHIAEHPNLNLLSNGNTTTDSFDDSCNSNQSATHVGNDSHGSTGSGNSTDSSDAADGAGSHNVKDGLGAGGLLGSTGLIGRGGLDLISGE